jgi:hypothetical protein
MKRAWEDAKLVMSHVESRLETKLESSARWKAIDQNQDVVELLKLIRGIVYQHDKVKQGTMSYVWSMIWLST